MCIKKAYAALELQQGASQKNVKLAYRRIMKELHPDLNPASAPEAKTRVIEIQDAYEVLMKKEFASGKQDHELHYMWRYKEQRKTASARGGHPHANAEHGFEWERGNTYTKRSMLGEYCRRMLDVVFFTWPFWTSYYFFRRNRNAALEVDVEPDGKAYLVNKQGKHVRAPQYDDL